MDDRAYQMLIDRLDRLEEKMDARIANGVEIAVLKAEMRLIKFVAGGLGIALLTLIAEAAWRILINAGV